MKNSSYQSVIAELNNCAVVCNQCVAACLAEEDVTIMAKCIQLDIDCAQVCSLVSAFAARNSSHAPHLMHECAHICNACAEECEKHSDMEHCKICAETCRQCATACQQLEYAA